MNNEYDENNGAEELIPSPEDELAPADDDKTSDCCEAEDNGFSGDSEDASAETETVGADTVIIGVRFRPNGKVYNFLPGEEAYAEGDRVIVETARGVEYGTVAFGNRTLSSTVAMPPLKPVLRRATAADDERHRENVVHEVEAFNTCVGKIADHKLDMKLVDVEYTFDRSKLLFYFTSEGRVDFRELVKDLAGVFRTRIELRQIGIRDEAKLMGGLGICGRPFCCRAFLDDFAQVSIKMAKEQSLSLNSNKISGSCGRLMCCLRYESDVYSEELKKTPKVDAMVETPEGAGIVTEANPLAATVKVRLLQKHDQPPKLFPRDDVSVSGNKHDWNEALSAKLLDEEQNARPRRERPVRERITAQPHNRRASFDAPPVEDNKPETVSDNPAEAAVSPATQGEEKNALAPRAPADANRRPPRGAGRSAPRRADGQGNANGQNSPNVQNGTPSPSREDGHGSDRRRRSRNNRGQRRPSVYSGNVNNADTPAQSERQAGASTAENDQKK